MRDCRAHIEWLRLEVPHERWIQRQANEEVGTGMKTLRIVSDSIVVLILFGMLALGCAASRTPCKITKPSPAITHDTALENPYWKCIHFGIDAKTKRGVFLCQSKVDGSKFLVSPID